MIVLCLSCKKNEPIVQTRLDGEWKILSDFYAATSGQNPADSSVLNYVGTVGDRYVFSSNGRVFLQQRVRYSLPMSYLDSDQVLKLPEKAASLTATSAADSMSRYFEI